MKRKKRDKRANSQRYCLIEIVSGSCLEEMDKNSLESIRNAKAKGFILTDTVFVSAPTIDYPNAPYIAFFYHETADEIGWANFDDFCKREQIPRAS